MNENLSDGWVTKDTKPCPSESCRRRVCPCSDDPHFTLIPGGVDPEKRRM